MQHIKFELTLEKAIDLALKKSAEYENALLDIEIYRMKVYEARSKRFPVITGSILGTAYLKFEDLPTGYDTWMGGKNFTILGQGNVGITLPLFTFGALSHGVELAEENLRTRTIQAEKIKKQVVLNVKKIFYGILIAKEQLKVATESYQVNQANYNIARRNFIQGLRPQIEMLQIQVTMEEARSKMIDADANIKNMKEQLTDLVGRIIYEEGTVLKGKLESEYLKVTLEQATNNAYNNNEDIKMANLSISLTQHQRVIISSNTKPRFSLFTNYSVTHVRDIQKTYPFADNGSKVDHLVTFGIRIDLPISEFLYPQSNNATRSQIGAIDYELQKTGNIIQRTKDIIKTNLTVLFNSKKNLETQIEVYKKLLEVAKNNLRIAQARYREGNMDYLSMRNIEIQTFSVILQYNKFLYDYIINKTEILHISGINE
jgi:outer membrane protein TolC